MRRYSRVGSRRRAPRRRRATVARRTFKKPSLNVRVKRSVLRLAETKETANHYGGVVLADNIYTYYELFNTGLPGTDHNQRLGAKVQSMGNRLNIILSSKNSLTQTFMVRVLVFRQKEIGDGRLATGVEFFDGGASTPTNFTGGIRDCQLPINKRLYTVVRDRLIPFDQFHPQKTLNMTVKASHKTLQYETVTSNYPSNDATYVMFIVRDVFNNGTGNLPCELNMYSRHNFKDM